MNKKGYSSNRGLEEIGKRDCSSRCSNRGFQEMIKGRSRAQQGHKSRILGFCSDHIFLGILLIQSLDPGPTSKVQPWLTCTLNSLYPLLLYPLLIYQVTALMNIGAGVSKTSLQHMTADPCGRHLMDNLFINPMAPTSNIHGTHQCPWLTFNHSP